MSGGVDSSVAAAMLIKAGFDVTGAFMVNYDEPGKSCWLPDYQDAVRVAAKLGIPLIKLDFTKEYRRDVLTYLYREYAAGRTPNPDVLCNKYVKFGAWLKATRKLGFEYLATGHYAKVSHGPKNRLLAARDEDKDQTYFLHQLSGEQLGRVMFPLGDYTKPQVRELARKYGLATAEKEESMGICFIGEVPIRDFLLKKIKTKLGKIISSGGLALGRHDGLAFYTIGQRVAVDRKLLKNESGHDSKPFFVLKKNIKKNELVVGYENDPLLFSREAKVEKMNWITGVPKTSFGCLVRLRHRQPLQACKVVINKRTPTNIKIIFREPQRAVTPGQFAVFYKKGECLGGGEII